MDGEAMNRTRGQPGIANRTMEVLCGGVVPEKVPPVLELIRAAVDDPDSLTNSIQSIVEDPAIKGLRFHLIRMQIESEINMREDVDRHAKRLWVSQTIERLTFGNLKLEGSKHEDDEDEE
jgi:hypothetical protein